MPDAVGLVKAMKRAGLEAMESSKPVNVYFGQVVSATPLQINVEQRMILGEAQLILSRNVTDYKTMVTVQWQTEKEEQTHSHRVEGADGEGGSISITSKTQSTKHTHDIMGQKEITIHNALKVDDEVILIRQQQGQKYIVVDRIGVMQK